MNRLDSPLLEIKDFSVELTSASGGHTHVLEEVSMSMAAGESIGIIGESGSGKSVLARSIIGVQPQGVTTEAQGVLRFCGQDIRDLSPRARRSTQAGRMAMIFQDPSSTLNPVVRVGRQVLEGAQQRTRLSRIARRRLLFSLLESVGLDDPARIARSYPGELSGGQRQRIGIAAALATEPLLLLADEPTTALDVTMQRTVLDVLDRLRAESGMGLIHITHDLGVLTDRTDRIAVMYAGRIVEIGPTVEILTAPTHPYTRALLEITPRLSTPSPLPLRTIPGSLPAMSAPREGCPFASRCPLARGTCVTIRPPESAANAVGNRHTVACWHPHTNRVELTAEQHILIPGAA